jgi:hypothetical protein
MDAKTRYRRRLKLQAAMTRLMEVLATNVQDRIPPDRTTALMMGQVVAKLIHFTGAAGLSPAETLPDRSDLSRFTQLKKARKKETRARYRRG